MTHREVLESLSGLMLVLLVAMLSSTIVSIALPTIVGQLHGTQNQYTWVVTATLLTATVATPMWGRLADLFSKKLMIQVAIGVFVVGSIVAGFAQDTPQLIAARALQGIGVGGLQALVQVVIGAMIPPRERGRYNGYLGAVMAVATVGGPLLGGVIVDTTWLGWRWCFFIGVPIAVAAFFLLQKTLHLMDVRQTNVKIDYLGATLISGGVSVLLVWFTFVSKSFAWLSWQTAALVIPALLILLLAVWVESLAAQPVVPLTIIRQKVPALATLASLAVGMALFGGAVFFGLYFQIGRGYSPTKAGLLTFPLMAGVLLASTIAGRLVSKTGKIKPYVLTGASSLVAGFVLLSFMKHDTPLWILWVGMLLVGAGVGMTMQNLVLSVQNTVALRDLGAASGAVTFFRSLGGTAGVAVLGAALASRVTSNVAQNLAKAGIPLPPGGVAGGGSLDLNSIPEPVRSIIRASYGDAVGHIFVISAVIGVVGLIAALLMPKVILRTSIDLPENDPVGIDGLPESEEAVAEIYETTDRSSGIPVRSKR
ncbi:MAG TPA: MDR family MFS transporter [Micromonosporaceae bacterium]|jgi:EmrB/QacA subfamily drug resistance transporter